MERRGAVCMQRGWRKWILQHRLNSIINIKKLCDKIIEPTFYIETNVFGNLRKIIDNDANRWRFEEQYINYQVDDEGSIGAQVFFSKTTRYDKDSTIPQWFGFEIPVRQFDRVFESDPNEILFKSENSNRYQTEVMSYSDIVQDSKITGMSHVNDLRFLKVTCDSIVEARRRVAVLALISYNVRNHTFIRGFSKACLRDPFFFSSLRKLYSATKINVSPVIPPEDL